MPIIALASPTQSDVTSALRAFMLDVLPAGYDVVLGGDNRVPEPKISKFAVMSPLRFERISTNYDDFQDVKFVGSVSGTTMTVTEVDHGQIVVGATLFGVGVADNTVIASGSNGTYTLSKSQSLSSRVLSAGLQPITVSWKHVVQVDFHSTDTTASSAATSIAAALRDDYGTHYFSRITSLITPLHADEPKSVPFLNEAKQVERRWVLEVSLQVNQTIALPMQYADSAVVGLIEVDSFYPPQ